MGLGLPGRVCPRGRTSLALGCASLHGDALLSILLEPFPGCTTENPPCSQSQSSVLHSTGVPDDATPFQPTHALGCHHSPASLETWHALHVQTSSGSLQAGRLCVWGCHLPKSPLSIRWAPGEPHAGQAHAARPFMGSIKGGFESVVTTGTKLD